MSVFVDQARNRFGRMKMSHMIADTRAELLAIVDRIGLRRRWIQNAGTYREHFDLCLTKREEAIAAGAVPITPRELAGRLKARK